MTQTRSLPRHEAGADRAGLSKSSPGRPRSTIGNRRRQRLEGQPAGQRRFDTRWPSSRFASITSTAPGQRHHGDMRWPRRPRRVASLTPRGRQCRPAPEPWWGRRIPSEPGFVLSPGGWTPPPGVPPAWNWLHPRVRHRVLTWCPGGRGSGTNAHLSTATRMHGCGGMGPGRSGRRIRSRGTGGTNRQHPAASNGICECVRAVLGIAVRLRVGISA